MPTTEILPFATGGGANVVTQSAYAADATTGSGFGSGVAASSKLNKVWRQSSFIAAGLANWMVGQGVSVPDDGNVSGLVTKITTALTAFVGTISTGFSTGDLKLTFKTVADAGWVMMNDGSIGNAASGASTRANADTSPLYTLFWNNLSNTEAPVSGGRGASAAADFAANKTLTLSKALGRAIAIAGSGSGLTARTLGSTVGEETHVLTIPEIPSHDHVASPYKNQVGSSAGTTEKYNADAAGTTGPVANPLTSATGGSGAHNNMQPTTFMNAMVKL